MYLEHVFISSLRLWCDINVLSTAGSTVTVTMTLENRSERVGPTVNPRFQDLSCIFLGVCC